MKAKRLLSAVLAVCLCAALIPRFALPVWADDPVEYILDRTPELAIFNAYTGSNSEYYEKYMSSWRYNAVAALKFENFSYDTKVGEDKEFYWRGFYKTYIAYLMDRTEHVEINYSNTMHNYEHKHTWGSWPHRKSQTITGQTNSLLYLTQSPDSTQDVDNYYVYYIFPPRSGEYNRVGNAEYTAVQTNINGDNSLWSTINGVSPAGQYLDMAIEFRNVPYYYNGGAKTCTCGGSGKGAAVTFYDGTAPKATVRNTRILKKVDGAIVGETNNFQPGETIVIELGMSEPVRFADKIPNKNTVYIGLLVEDDPVMRYASLTKLENRGPNASERKNTSTLTFEYTVPATQTGLTTITNLDLSAAPSSKSALVHKDADIDLKQMARRDPMTTQYTLLEVAKPNSASSAKGFTKTTSWVTDMAGNALVASNPSVNIYIDCQRPFVAEAVASAEMNNKDVKEDRGVTASDANYRDESDLYMGDGDSFTMTLFMNEVILADVYYPCALITTNLRTAGGDPVTATARLGKNVDAETIGTEYGKGPSKGKVSTFTTEPITIVEGMTLSSGKEIAIETVEFRDFANVRDEAGNEVVSIVGGKPLDKALKIDTDAPYATDISAFQMGPNSDFYVRFKVSDAISGAGELYGTITLYDAGRENGAGYVYRYAVTSDSGTPADEPPAPGQPNPWKDGGVGTPMRFMQTGEDQYLHFKRVDGIDYDFLQLAADFKLKDLAGNSHVRTVDLSGDIILDETAPSVTAGNVSRSYDADTETGTMEVSFTVSDLAGLSAISYLWADPADAVTADTEGWTAIGGFAAAAASYTASAATTVASEASIEKALWVKASDIIDNEDVFCCGSYRYDLTGVQYSLSYPSGINGAADLSLAYQLMHQEDGGGLSTDFIVMDVQKGDEATHYVAVFGKDAYVGSGAFNPLNASEVTWYEVPEEAISEAGGIVSYGDADNLIAPSTVNALKKVADSDGYVRIHDWGTDYIKFNGELKVTVYSGCESGITYTKPGSAQKVYFSIDKSTERFGEESFTMKLYPYSGIDYGFEVVTDADAEIFTYRNDRNWVYTGDPNEPDLGSVSWEWLNSSLEGYQVSFDISAKPGWEWALDDIDWSKSFIALIGDANIPSGYDEYHGLQDYGEMSEYEPLRLCGVGAGLKQTITLPASDLYVSGRQYDCPTLVLARKSRPDYPFVVELVPDNDYSLFNDFYIDATEPGSVVPGLLCYSPYTYFSDTDGRDISNAFPEMLIDYDPSRTIYVPASNGSVDMMFQVLDAAGEPDLRDSGNVGAYDVIAWNVTYPDEPMVHLYEDMDVNNGFCFYLHDEYGITNMFDSGKEHGLHSLAFSVDGRMQYNLSTYNIGSPLYVASDVDNLIAVQVRYLNGRASEITYLTIHPVTLAPQGTVTASPEAVGILNASVAKAGDLTVTYTPAEGENTFGLTYYLVQGVPHENGLGYVCFHDEEPVVMEQNSDGSFTATVPSEQSSLYGCPFPYYGVYARDRLGNLSWAGTVGPLFVDSTGPYVWGDDVDVVDGRFEVVFEVDDESLYLAPSPDLFMDLNLYFAPEEYNEFLGDADASLPLRIYPGEGTFSHQTRDDGYGEYEADVYTNTVPVETNSLGIDGITTELVFDSDYGTGTLFARVSGYISPYAYGIPDLELHMNATDLFGHMSASEWSYVELHEVSATALLVTNAELVDTGGDKALKLTFSAPVQPAASWICPDPAGYAKEWTDAFPITCDGTWEISYYDPFGTIQSETITLTDVFGDYGLTVDFSTLDYTTEPVSVTVTQAAGYDSLGTQDPSITFYYGQPSVTVETEESGTIRFFSFAPGETMGYWSDVADILDVHVSNIVQPQPQATIWLYFDSLQNAFIAGAPEQPTGEIPGAVTVYYRTDREVSPSGPDSLVIRPGDSGDFSFAYYDEVSGRDYAIEGNLSQYGITLKTDPDAPAYVDTESPDIDHVTVWAMQGGVFTQANAFNGAADEAAITDAFSEDTTGWAQGYDLVLNASDYSKWKLLAFAAEPAAVSFADTGDDLEGVSIQANNVLLTDQLAGDVYIVCVDNAAAETGAAADNFTCIKIPYSALRFDNQAPEIFHTDNSATDLYERVVYLRGTDDHTDASVIAFSGEGVELNPGTDADHPASVWPYRVVFHQNGSLLVTAKDQAGNTSSLPIDVDNIDSRTPTLSVTWSPCFKDEDTGEMIESSPTAGPVNLDVIAHVTSNMPIYDVKATVIGTSPDVPELREESEVYFADKVDTSYPAYGPTVAGAFDDQLVSIYFRGSSEVPYYPDPAQPDYVMVPYDQEVTVRVYAPNGQSAAVTLTLPGGTIDQVSPDVWFEYEPVVREGFEDACQEKVKALFDEDVYCIGGPGVVPGNTVYSAANPYVVTLTDMEETGAYTFVDMAGNLLPDPNDPAARPITFKADSGMIIDSSAPSLSLETPGASSGENYRAELRFTDDRSYCRLEVTGPATVTVGAAGSPQTDADGNSYWVIPLTLAGTGNFTAVGYDKAGNAARLVFTVDAGDLTPPIMSFSPSTVTLIEGAAAAELAEKLEAGIALWDNGTGEADLRASLTYDASAVQLNRPGVYTVIYTATDNAGNVATAARSVKIISASLPAVTVDGDPTELNGTLSISVGRHQLSVGNLQIPGEPCRVILVKGRWSEGQLKLVDEGLAVDESGWFDLDAEGFYTLYILTQSRQSYRTLLYAE